MTSNATELTCKFTARIEQSNDRYIVEVPETEIEYGAVSPGDVCGISVQVIERTDRTETDSTADDQESALPVSVGEQRTVEIEDLGTEGDGIARVERGYVLIVPDAEPGDEVRVEITDTTPNVGFTEVIEEGREGPSNAV